MINCHTFFFDGTEGSIKLDEIFIKNLTKNDKLANEKSLSTFSISTLKR